MQIHLRGTARSLAIPSCLWVSFLKLGIQNGWDPIGTVTEKRSGTDASKAGYLLPRNQVITEQDSTALAQALETGLATKQTLSEKEAEQPFDDDWERFTATHLDHLDLPYLMTSSLDQPLHEALNVDVALAPFTPSLKDEMMELINFLRTARTIRINRYHDKDDASLVGF